MKPIQNDEGFDKFFKICEEVVDTHAPRKKKYIRKNQSPFINKTLKKEIMKRTKSINNLIKTEQKKIKKNKPRKETFLYHF